MPKRRKQNSTAAAPSSNAPRALDTQKRIADMSADEYRRLAIQLQESLNGKRGGKH